jgi:hypothetical protein
LSKPFQTPVKQDAVPGSPQSRLTSPVSIVTRIYPESRSVSNPPNKPSSSESYISPLNSQRDRAKKTLRSMRSEQRVSLSREEYLTQWHM